MKINCDTFVTCGKSGIVALAMLTLASCTPRFNRQGQLPTTGPVGLSNPIMDLASQGGSATPGVTPHFKVTRVAIGGNVQRIRSSAPSGKSLQGGPNAPL